MGVCAALGPAWGQQATQSENVGGIYVCVDAKGRRLTSDRPILECLDREQRVLTSSGATRRIIPPTLTADERAQAEARAQQEVALKAKLSEEVRRDRALLARYPNQQQHDMERLKQLSAVDRTQTTIEQRTEYLVQQREKLHAEMEFYKADPSKAPAWLQHRLKDNAEQQEGQKRLLAAQMEERRRIHARFDEELQRLKQLWASLPASR